jgi:hypothetical protein
MLKESSLGEVFVQMLLQAAMLVGLLELTVIQRVFWAELILQW